MITSKSKHKGYFSIEKKCYKFDSRKFHGLDKFSFFFSILRILLFNLYENLNLVCAVNGIPKTTKIASGPIN